jgi:hypothetical protein
MLPTRLVAVTRKSGRFAAVFTKAADLCHDEHVNARTFWFLTLPALLLAETAGHTFTARVLDSGDRRHGLLSHALDAYGPSLLVLAVLLAGAILWRRVLASLRAERRHPLPTWRLAALPAAGFLVQEHVEQLVRDERPVWLTAVEPVVLTGIAIQLLLGLVAIWLVRTLLRAAEQLGCTLARRGARAARRPQSLCVNPLEAFAPRLPALASQQAGRAPPAVT